MGQKFAHPSIALQTALVTASHARGLKVLAHATSLPDTLAVLEAGVDGLAHTFYDQAPTEGLIEAYRKNNAWCCPTLVAMGSLSGEGVDVQHRFAEDGRIAKVLTKAQQDHMCKCAHFKAETSKLQYSYDSVRALHEAGIDIVRWVCSFIFTFIPLSLVHVNNWGILLVAPIRLTPRWERPSAQRCTRSCIYLLRTAASRRSRPCVLLRPSRPAALASTIAASSRRAARRTWSWSRAMRRPMWTARWI